MSPVERKAWLNRPGKWLILRIGYTLTGRRARFGVAGEGDPVARRTAGGKSIKHGVKNRLIILLLLLPTVLFGQERTVVLTFDDACESQYSFVAPLLKQYGFGATFYVCEFPGMFGDSTKSMSWQQMKELSAVGFEIGNHTWHHKNLDRMAPGELDTELSHIEQKCDSLGIPKPTSFAYPAYREDPASIPTLIRHGYRTARTGGDRPWQPSTDDPLHVPSYTIKGDSPEDKRYFYQALQQAVAGKVIVFTIHGVPDIAHPWVSTPPAVLKEYLQYLYDHHYRVVSMREFRDLPKPREFISLSPGGDLPLLTLFRAKKDRSKGTAVIVCSGGAYAFRSDGGEGVGEGVPACRKLQDAGITAFLLDYRLPAGNDTVPLHDVQLAIKYIRANAKAFHLDPRKIGILGFSAGGHLAATADTHFKNAAERPDFMVLVYPVISMADSLTHPWSRSNLLGGDTTPENIKLYSNELQVTENTPGAFIVHSMDDDGVKVDNSLYFEAALEQHRVPVKLFLYAKGGHGFGIVNRTATVQWTDSCIDWIKQMKWKE